MTTWLRERSSRRAVLAGGPAAAGTSALGATGALGQTDHLRRIRPRRLPNRCNRRPATPALTAPWSPSGRSTTAATASTRQPCLRIGRPARSRSWANGQTLRDLRDRRGGQGDRDRAGPDVPGLDVQWTRSRADIAGDRRRPPRDRLQELRLTPALDALPRYPLRPHGRRSGRRHGRSRRRVRLRVRRQAVWLSPLPLPRPAAETSPAQGHVRRLHHRSRSGPASRTCRCRPVAPARHCRKRWMAGTRDGDERLRHQFRRRERGLRGQHSRPLLHEGADPDRARAGRSASISST